MPGRLKWSQVAGLLMKESGYQLGGFEFLDVTSTLNVPATTGNQYFELFGIPPFQSLAALLGSQEVYGGDGRAKLAAAASGLAIGQWNSPIGQIGNIGLLSVNNAAPPIALAYAATLTLQIQLIGASDTSATAQVSNLMTAALALNTITNAWTLLALNNIPAFRQVLGANGQAIANAFYIFPGDSVFAWFANTAGAPVTVAAGNKLALAYEVF